MVYRIKQFVWAMAAKMNIEEKEFVNHYLSDKERKLFYRLRVYEQKHSVRVAYELKKRAAKNQEVEYIRLGLLHDIGKSIYPLNPIEKSIIVVLDYLTKGKIQKMSHLKMVKCYYHHGIIGYNLLSESGDYHLLFLEAIKNHHGSKGISNPLIKALKECDDLN